MPGRNQDYLVDAGGLALMVGAPLACSPWLADGVVIPKLALFLIGCHLVVAGWVWGAFAGRWPWLSRDRLVTLTTVLLLWWSLAGSSWSWHWPERLLLVHLALLLQALAATLDAERRSRWTGWLVGTGLLVTLYSVMQRLDLDPMGWKHPLDPFMVRDRTISTFGNPNYFAAFTAVLVPLAGIRLLVPKQSAVAACVAGLGTVTVVLSQTRAAWLALAAAALAMLLRRDLRALAAQQWRPLVVTAAASLVLLVGLAQVHPESDQRSQYRQNRQEASITTRLALWTAALCITEENLWVGTGPDGFPSNYLPYRGLEDTSELSFGRIPEHCHHELLTIWFEAGLPGVVLSLALALFVLYRVRIAEDPLAQAGGAALLGLLVNLNFITATLTLRTLYLFLLVLLVPATESEEEPSSRAWPGLVILLWILLVTGYCGRMISAERKLWWADDYAGAAALLDPSNQAEHQRAIGLYQQALLAYNEAEPGLWPPRRSELMLKRSGMLLGLYRVAAVEEVAQVARQSQQELMRSQPWHPYPYAHRATLLALEANFHQGLQADIARAWLQALERDPWNPLFSAAAGSAQLELAHPQGAAGLLRESLRSNPDEPRTHLNLGRALCKLGQSEAAEAQFQRTLELDPKAAEPVEQARRECQSSISF